MGERMITGCGVFPAPASSGSTNGSHSVAVLLEQGFVKLERVAQLAQVEEHKKRKLWRRQE
jgi:hypothetical protein